LGSSDLPTLPTHQVQGKIVNKLTTRNGQIKSNQGHEITQNRSADMHNSEPTNWSTFSQIIHFLWDILGSDFQYF
jgi:hypothetical protein